MQVFFVEEKELTWPSVSPVTEYFNCRHDINWIVAEEQTLPGAFRDSSLFCFELKFKCKQTRKPSYRNQAVAI